MLFERGSVNFNRATNYKTKKYTYQNILFDHMQQLGNFIIGRRQDPQFNIPITKIPRNDPIELQQRLMEMSPTERKRLGINESTLVPKEEAYDKQEC